MIGTLSKEYIYVAPSRCAGQPGLT